MPATTPDQVRVPRAVLLGTLSALVVITVANNSMGALAQPEIARDFGAGPADVGWVVFGFGASFAVSTAVWGAIGRRFGFGRALAVAVVLLSIASLVAAAAPDLLSLVASRIVQGLGSGAIPTLGASLIALRFSGPSRATAFGVIVASVGTGLALGPILGGALIDLAGWRAVVGLAALAAPAAGLMLIAHPRGGDIHARVDLTGAALVAGVALGTVLLLNRWLVVGLAPITFAGIALVVVTIPALAWHTLLRGGSFLPRAVMLDPTYRRLALLGAIGMSAFLGTLVIVPVAVARAQGLAGLELGLVILPMAVTAALVSPNNGRVTGRFGHGRTLQLSLGLLVTGLISLAILGAAAPPLALAAALIPLGAGFGLLNAPLLEQLVAVFEGPLAPVAVGSYNLIYFLGGSLGASASTAVLQSRVSLPFLPADAVEPGFASALLLLAVLPGLAAALHGPMRILSVRHRKRVT